MIGSGLTNKIFQRYPDERAARVYLEKRRWPTGVVSPCCAKSERITPRANGFYRCNFCKTDFTVRTGTIFERSHVPLHKWVYARFLFMTAKNGISSAQLGKEIGVTQKSAWFILRRIREACGDRPAEARRADKPPAILRRKPAVKSKRPKRRQT